MELISSFEIELPQLAQYQELLRESGMETFFYGTPLNHMKERIVLIVDGNVVGAFEPGTVSYDGKIYYRTNRPYTFKEQRGKGYMLEALKQWYQNRRPAMCWIDDSNLSSIRLFQNVGFRRDHDLEHKGQQGSIYFLKK